MSAYTKEELAQTLETWKKALDACATGRSYSIGDRTLTMYDLPEIRSQIEWLERRQEEAEGRSTLMFVKPRFRR